MWLITVRHRSHEWLMWSQNVKSFPKDNISKFKLRRKYCLQRNICPHFIFVPFQQWPNLRLDESFILFNLNIMQLFIGKFKTRCNSLHMWKDKNTQGKITLYTVNRLIQYWVDVEFVSLVVGNDCYPDVRVGFHVTVHKHWVCWAVRAVYINDLRTIFLHFVQIVEFSIVTVNGKICEMRKIILNKNIYYNIFL